MPDNGVFISYRRDTGSEVARILQEFLEGQGFDVFLDVDSLGAGHFDEQLLKEIESRRNFVLVCSPGSLDRCANEGDWVRQELAHALKTKRHVVPVVLPGFAWPSGDGVPAEVAALKRHNAFEYSHSHWSSIRRKLVGMLESSAPRRPAEAAVSQASGRPASNRVLWISLAVLTVTLASAVGWVFLGGGQAELNWAWDAEVLAASPDPKVVTDADGRARMVETGLPWKVRDRTTGIVMLLCPPGEFMMGSPESEQYRGDDEAQQRVSITTAFYMSETEVTQEQWQKIMWSNPSYFKRVSNPVEKVSWDDCQEFCVKTGLRLPSEAEWEYACRAGTTGAYAGDLDSMGWYGDNSGVERIDALALWNQSSLQYSEAESANGCQTHPVRQKRANPWGLYDMDGNVAEWCEDPYWDRASGKQAPATRQSFARVLRGGGWNTHAAYCRSASRFNLGPGLSDDYIGFRVARTPG